MANRLFSRIALTNTFVINNVIKSNSYAGILIGLQGKEYNKTGNSSFIWTFFFIIYLEQTRQLYAIATLGLDGFINQQEMVQKQMENISEKFKVKMDEYCQDNNKNMIFSEDLKNMVHLATTSKDVDVVVKMIKK